MSRSPNRLLLTGALLGSLFCGGHKAQAKDKVYDELISNMVSYCVSSEVEREQSASGPCRRRMAKVKRLGAQILPELLTGLRQQVDDGRGFGVELLLEFVTKQKSAAVIETLIGLLQIEPGSDGDRVVNDLDRALNELTGADKKGEGHEEADETRQQVAQRWKTWWQKNRASYASRT